MNTMRAAVEPLAELEVFKKIFEVLQNPLLGVLAGAVITVCTQSSAAAVGILQAISGSGAIVFASAFPIIMGTNIGTCVTPMLSSLNSSKNAKRAGLLHFYFNLIGTILFLIAIYTIQATVGWSFWNKEFTTGDIANFHTIFNLVVTAFFIPLAGVLEKLACLTVRDKPGEDEDELEEDTLDERFLVTPNVAIAQTSEAVVQMGIQAQKNFKAVVDLYANIDDFDPKLAENIREREDTIDRLEDRVGQYLIKLNDCGLNEDESRRVTAYFHLISEFERIGDYTINILETAEALYDAEASFSAQAREELRITFAAISEIIELAIKATESMEIEDMIEVEPLEEVVDRIVEELKSVHINRAKSGICKVDVGVHFIDILTNVERISDHCSNIAVYLLTSRQEYSTLKKHEYLDKLHKNGPKTYEEKLAEYSAKYAIS
ncbi:MAG: Na/Pi cotransporter family protein, partial [Ruminococcus sp.]|nr:Na/Pi cotransporter family protein [Ruminococcus sp.]